MISVYFTDTIYLVNETRDQWGEPTETATAVRARVEWRDRLVTDRAGKQVLAQAAILLPDTTTLAPTTKLRVDGVDYQILTTRELKDWSVRGLEVFL